MEVEHYSKLRIQYNAMDSGFRMSSLPMELRVGTFSTRDEVLGTSRADGTCKKSI
jgi:hypothetical protein